MQITILFFCHVLMLIIPNKLMLLIIRNELKNIELLLAWHSVIYRKQLWLHVLGSLFEYVINVAVSSLSFYIHKKLICHKKNDRENPKNVHGVLQKSKKSKLPCTVKRTNAVYMWHQTKKKTNKLSQKTFAVCSTKE